MIKALRIDYELDSKVSLRALAEFLDCLGLQNESATSGAGDRSQIFSAPLGKVSAAWVKQPPNQKEAVALWDFAIEVDDPDSAHDLIHKRGFQVVSDYSEYQSGSRHFVVKITPKLRVAIFGTVRGWMGMGRQGDLNASGKRFALVVARFNSFISERLLDGALDALRRTGARNEHIKVVRVPGSFEIPSAARTLAQTRKYDAIICLGCLIRGDTAHYDVIANEVTRGIGQSAQETGVPHAFGVLTCDNLEQAIDRAGLKSGNKGFEAALAAVEMASLKKAISHQEPGVRKTAARRSAVSKNPRRSTRSKASKSRR